MCVYCHTISYMYIWDIMYLYICNAYMYIDNMYFGNDWNMICLLEKNPSNAEMHHFLFWGCVSFGWRWIWFVDSAISSMNETSIIERSPPIWVPWIPRCCKRCLLGLMWGPGSCNGIFFGEPAFCRSLGFHGTYQWDLCMFECDTVRYDKTEHWTQTRNVHYWTLLSYFANAKLMCFVHVSTSLVSRCLRHLH